MNFQYDFVSKHQNNWLKWLSEFKDKPCRLLEIGSFEGRSIIWFFQNILTHPDCRATCMDTFQWMNARERFDANVEEAGISGRLTVKQQSSAWLHEPGEAYSIVYVDGAHLRQRVLMDAVLCWRSLKPGGIMIFDDYLLKRGADGELEVKIGCDAFLRVYANDLEVISQGYQLCIRRMK